MGVQGHITIRQVHGNGFQLCCHFVTQSLWLLSDKVLTNTVFANQEVVFTVLKAIFFLPFNPLTKQWIYLALVLPIGLKIGKLCQSLLEDERSSTLIFD